MTAPTIPPQQPEPEPICRDCRFYAWGRQCVVTHHMPHPFRLYEFHDMPETGTCVLFRARKES